MIGKTWNQRLLSLLCLSAALILVALPAQAQDTSVTGKVVDQGKAVIPGVIVTLTSSTGAERTVETDPTGVYRFLNLRPGTYQLKAELQGFKTAVVDSVVLLVDTPGTIDLEMEIGEITELVTVEANAAKLNVTDATLGNAFEGVRIRELPLESRNVANLLSLQPAVTETGYVSGARSDQSNLTLDGIDVNEQQQGTAFETVLRVSPDSVQEFRVTTSTPDATMGRSSGGQVSLVTRTGTNEYHGSLYYFHRNTVTTANTFFNNRIGEKTPKLLRNLFGGSFGGPIIKDRMFFFYNYEGRRDAKETSVINAVPLAVLGQGAVKYNNDAGGVTTLTTEDINRIYPAGANPAAIAVLAEAAGKYPSNDSGIGDGLNYGGFRFNAPLPLKHNAHTATLFFNLDEQARHTLSLRGNYQHDLEAGAPRFPDSPGTDLWSHPLGYTASHTWTISPKVVNTFRFGVTRQAFSDQGDSSNNSINFRFVYSPRDFSRTLSRLTPVYNIVDDIAWVKGNHTWQFGTNIRLIRNTRDSFSGSYDSAVTNPSFYENSGAVLSNPIPDIAGNVAGFQAGLTAVIGRFSQYSGNYNFDASGSLLDSGLPVSRDFATEEYEFYAQDTWRVRPSLTLTFGMRYSLNTPVYESNGLQVKPTVSLGGYFEKRKASSAQGMPFWDPFEVDLAGPANNRPGFYQMDTNNFAPRASAAWSPSFENSFLQKIFGTGQKSVFRGGFAMSYDRIGSRLAVTFDLNNTLGFSSSDTISANTYNVSDNPGPRFTGFDQDVRSLPGLVIPDSLVFPLMTPADGRQRIESTLDDSLTTPRQYQWNFSLAREFDHGFTVEASYIGRSGRDLLATRDIMHLNNLVDAESGMDWYTAGGMLQDARLADTPIDTITPIPYFENLFPGFRGNNAFGYETSTSNVFHMISRDGWDYPDYTYIQLVLDDEGKYENAFFHPQYAALATWSTVGYSDYHAGTLSLKQRLSSLSLDLNYTFSKSTDIGSSLERSGTYDALIQNPLRPKDMHAISTFDITHILNSNTMWELPLGSGRRFMNSLHPVANALLGGWQLTGVFRWNSGRAQDAPIDAQIWATNWNAQSNGIRVRPIDASPTKAGDHPNFFSDAEFAYQSFRNARPGETGDRNIFRRGGYFVLDFGLSKSFQMPFAEGHRIQIRWEVFNATNTQLLAGPAGGRSGYGFDLDPFMGSPGPDFGFVNATQGDPRVMQFAFRYDF